MRRRLTGLFVSACLGAGLLISGCDYLPTEDEAEEGANTPPAIVGIFVGSEVITDTTMSIQCLATDNQDQPQSLTYAWSVDQGTISGTQRTASWQTPSAAATASVTCSATDTGGLSASYSTQIKIVKR